MKVRISHGSFGQCFGVLLTVAAITGVLAFGAPPRDRLYYHNDHFHYGFTVPKGWELAGDDLLDAMNKSNQVSGLPRIDAIVRSLNETHGLAWSEVHKAEPLNAGGFEGYVRDIESVAGLSPQKMAEQIDKPELKELMRESAHLRLVSVDRTSWRVLTETEQPSLDVKNADATCFGYDVTVKVAYHATANVFSEHYLNFSSVVGSLAFDAGHQYSPKAHSAPAARFIPGMVPR